MRLLTLSNEKIIQMIESMERETKAIKSDVMQMVWFMRGGVTYQQAMDMGQEEKVIVGKLVKSNMETTKTSGLPFF